MSTVDDEKIYRELRAIAAQYPALTLHPPHKVETKPFELFIALEYAEGPLKLKLLKSRTDKYLGKTNS